MRHKQRLWAAAILCAATPLALGATINVPANYSTIQAAINAASSGDTIQVAAGTYVENITVNKSLAIIGAGAGQTIIKPAVSAPGGDSGPSFTGSQVVVVQAHNVEIAHLTVDGDNTALTSGVVRHGADIDARNGIIEADGPWNGLHVHHCEVKNIYLRGIYARSGGSGFNFHDNTVTNVDGGWASIAIFNFGGSGQITNNTVTLANDAIASNWSRGTTYTGNIVSQCGSGIHTDNNGGSGGVADLISGNQVLNSVPGGWGIFVFFPYVNATVSGNTISDVDYGMMAWGGAGGTATFTSNTINCNNRAGSVGIYVTPGPDAWMSWQSNVVTSFSGNTVSNATYGFALETDEDGGYTAAATVSSQGFSGCTWDCETMGTGTITVSGLSGNKTFVSWPGQIKVGAGITAAGGQVDVQPGTYNETQIQVPRAMTIRGYTAGPLPCPGPESGAPIVDGGSQAAPNANGFVIMPGVDDVTIENFYIRNFGQAPAASGGVGCGVFAYNTSPDPTEDITVRHCQFDNNVWASVFFWNTGESAYDGIDVNCNVVNTGPWSSNTNVYGIECTNCTNSQIRENTLSGGYTPILMTAQTASGASVTTFGGNTIADNVVGLSAERSIYVVAFPLSGGPTPTLSNITIQGNTVNNSRGSLIVYAPGGQVSDVTVLDNTFEVTNAAASHAIADISAGGTNVFTGNVTRLLGSAPPSFMHGLNLPGAGGFTSTTWTINDNLFDGGGLAGLSVGIRLRDSLPADTVLSAAHNLFKGLDAGVRANGLPSGPLTSYVVSDSVFLTTNGVINAGSPNSALITAVDNFWGHSSGPFDTDDGGETINASGGCSATPALESNPSGTGNPVIDTVSAPVDYCPWLLSAASVSLLPQGGDVCYAPGDTLVVEIKVHDLTVPIVGGQFFLNYDTSKLTYVGGVPGDAPFNYEFADLAPPSGQPANTIFYSVGTGFVNPPSTSADTVVARLTFTVNAAASACDLAGLVGFQPDSGPYQNKLSDAFANPVFFSASALPAITLDGVAPIITCPPDISMNWPLYAPLTVQDTFDTINPAWVTDRYEPGVFASTVFDGDERLQIGIRFSGAAHNRPPGQQGVFYATQGRQRVVTPPSTPFWEVSADLYVSNDMIAGNNLRRTDLWARTGNVGNETNANYPILGLRRFDPSDAFNPSAPNITTVWRLWDPDAGGWVNLSHPVPVTAGWHTLTIRGTGVSYEFEIDGTLVYTDTTVNGLPLTTLFLQAYNFGLSAMQPGQEYDVYWDDLELTQYANTGLPTVSDNCDPKPLVTYTDTVTPGLCPSAQTITRVWIATDCSGNSASCTQIIQLVDGAAPTITCPPDVTVECDQSLAPGNTGTPTVVDDCDPSPAVVYEDAYTAFAGLSSPAGWLFYSQKTARGQFVTGPATPPLGSGSIRLTTGPGDPPAPPPVSGAGGKSWLATYAHDGTPLSAITTLSYSTYVSLSSDAAAHLTPALNLYVDLDGNGSRDTTLVFEPVYVVSQQGPVIKDVWQTWDTLNGPGWWYTSNGGYPALLPNPGNEFKPLSHYLALFPNAKIVSWGSLPGFNIVTGQNTSGAPWQNFDGNVDNVVFNSATYDFDPGAGVCAATIERTWTATDSSSNSASCVQTITVQDTTPPVIPSISNVNVNNDPGQCSAVVTFTLPTITDNCSTPTVVALPPSGSTFPVGTTTVTVTATDACGNSSSTTFNVIVADAELPTIACNQGDITVPADAGGCTASITWNAATASDNCTPAPTVTYEIDLDNNGSIDVTNLTSPTYTFPAGTHKVYAKATDAHSNVATCFFLVTVNGYSELKVYLTLESVTANVNRCITFDLWDGSSSTTVAAVIPFTGGVANGVVVQIPCGSYTCISARDKLHTLRRTITGGPHFAVSGTQYVADFNAAGKILIGGNLNDDQYIDILDFGVYAWQYAVNYGTANTTCATPYPHADITCDAVVDAFDFTYIQIHFLAGREAACSGAALSSDGSEPVTSITVDELAALGLGELALGDLNEDGVLDVADIQAFLAGARPGPRLGDVNCDGVVSFDDIDAFVAALAGRAAFGEAFPGCNWLAADTNRDGRVTFEDIDAFVTLLHQGE